MKEPEIIYPAGKIEAALKTLKIRDLSNMDIFGKQVTEMFEKTSLLPPYINARNVLNVFSANSQLEDPNGDKKTIVWNMPHNHACISCAGIGIDLKRNTDVNPIPCKKCSSTGTWTRKCKMCKDKDEEAKKNCSNCKGIGSFKTPCLACVERDENKKVIAKIGKGHIMVPSDYGLITSFTTCTMCNGYGRKGGIDYFVKTKIPNNPLISKSEAELIREKLFSNG